MTELRRYQTGIIAAVHQAIAAGKRRPIIPLPTGGGKTVIAAEIIKDAKAKGQRVLVIAHSREIIKQTSEKLFAQGVEHGIIQAGFATKPYEEVQVASIQTLSARAVRTRRMELPPADLIIVDEAHHTPAYTYRKIVNSYPDAVIIGLTATPCRGDGRGLGGIFDVIVDCLQVAELIEQKFLVKTRVFAPVTPANAW